MAIRDRQVTVDDGSIHVYPVKVASSDGSHRTEYKFS